MENYPIKITIQGIKKQMDWNTSKEQIEMLEPKAIGEAILSAIQVVSKETNP